MYLRYDENQFKEQKNDFSESKTEYLKQTKREKSKLELILSIGAVLFALEYTKQHEYFTSTEEQCVLALILGVTLNVIIESFIKWISK